MLFTFPSRYLFTIGLLRVFSLAGWSRRIHAGFLVPRATQDDTMSDIRTDTQLSCSTAGLSRPFSLVYAVQRCAPSTPSGPEPRWFGLFPGRSPLLGESRLFSLPPATKMFQFAGFASCFAGCRSVRPAGCPIRKSPGQRPFASNRGLSQLVTSFIACKSLGIRQMPLPTFFYARILCRRPH